MRKRRFFISLSLFAIFLAACAPASSTVSPVQPVTVIPSETLPATVAASDTALPATAVPTENLPATQLPVATSRGPNLEATDPKTVSMASGGLQFVEFFEFW